MRSLSRLFAFILLATLHLSAAALPIVSIDGSNQQLPEGQNRTITASATGFDDNAETVAVYFSSTGSATYLDDYYFEGYSKPNGVVYLSPNQPTATLELITINNTEYEQNEQLTVSLVKGFGYQLSADSSTAITIIDDDLTPVVSITKTVSTAYESGNRAARFVVRSNIPVERDTTVFFRILGTATMGSEADYVPINTSITIMEGQQESSDIIISPNSDNTVEQTEIVTLELTTNDGTYTIGPERQASINIIDGESTGQAQILNTTSRVSERQSTLEIDVARIEGTQGALNLSYSLIGGLATLGEDVVTTSGTLSWLDGESSTQSFIINIVDDDRTEVIEDFTVVISDAATNEQIDTLRIEIVDDERASERPFVVSFDNFSAIETAAISDSKTYQITVLDNDSQPLPNIDIAWALDNDSGTDQGTFRGDLVTNDNGIATVDVYFGNTPATYELSLTATANLAENDIFGEVTSTVLIGVGIVDTAENGSRQKDVATALDRNCALLLSQQETLTENQRQLANVCQRLLTAIEQGASQDVANLIQSITPDIVRAQVDANRALTEFQINTVKSRLSNLRSGIVSNQLVSLDLDWNSYQLPLNYLMKSIDGNDTSEPIIANRWGTFITGNIKQVDKSESDGFSGFESMHTEVIAGLDFKTSPKLVIGAALGLGQGDIDDKSDNSNVETEHTLALVYANWQINDTFYADIVTGAGKTTMTSDREIENEIINNINLGLNIPANVATSTTDMPFYNVAISTGANVQLGKGWQSDFNLQIDYQAATIEAYTETGLDGLNFSIEEIETDSTSIKLGTQVSKAISTSMGVFMPTLGVYWHHQFSDPIDIQVRFAEFEEGEAINFTLEDEDSDYLQSNFSLTAVFPMGFSAFGSYSKVMMRDQYEQSHYSLGARWQLQF